MSDTNEHGKSSEHRQDGEHSNRDHDRHKRQDEAHTNRDGQKHEKGSDADKRDAE